MCLEDPSQLDQLMSELRQRFTIKEGEGQPVDWLLGMRIHQNVEKGYLSMDQELVITKLAKVILDDNEMNSAHYVKHPMLHSSPLPRLAQDSPILKFVTNLRGYLPIFSRILFYFFLSNTEEFIIILALPKCRY